MVDGKEELFCINFASLESDRGRDFCVESDNQGHDFSFQR